MLTGYRRVSRSSEVGGHGRQQGETRLYWRAFESGGRLRRDRCLVEIRGCQAGGDALMQAIHKRLQVTATLRG
jgi:hypothetical protein